MISICPNEETIVNYIEGNLSVSDRDKLEEHFSNCRNCIEEIVVLNELINNYDSLSYKDVPYEVTKSALDLTINRRNLIISAYKKKFKFFIDKIKDKIADYTMIFWADWQLAPIRGSKVVLARNHSRRRKDFEEIKTDIEIEKTGDNQAQIRVMLHKDDSADQKIRVILIKRKKGLSPPILDREIASHIIENGSVLFENIPFDHYKLTFTKDGVTLGRYLFQIK